MDKAKNILLYSTLTVAGLYFLFIGLVKSGPFLIPLLTAMVLAFMMLPVTNKLEQWGFKKIFATLTSTLAVILILVGFATVVFFQIMSFTDDWEKITEKFEENFDQATKYLVENTPLEQEQLEKYLPEIGGGDEGENAGAEEEEVAAGKEEAGEAEEGDGEGAAKSFRQKAVTVMGVIFGFITNLLITFIYIFLFIHFRDRFKGFILRFFPEEKEKEVSVIVSRTSSVSRGYLAGRLLLMVILAVLYYIGLLISGLDNALLISLIAAALSIIPFLGNFLGYFIALAVGLLSDGGSGVYIGVTVTFLVAQFVDSYVLQPIVLGDKVDVHPLFIIMSVILGNEIWGIMGMVLAIPIFSMVAVVCRHVPTLHPFGYLFSKQEIKRPENTPENKHEYMIEK